MNKGNDKNLEQKLKNILFTNEYENKTFTVYDKYFDEQEANFFKKFDGFNSSRFERNLPIIQTPSTSKHIIELVCNYVSQWEFVSIYTSSNKMTVNFSNNHKIEIIPVCE